VHNRFAIAPQFFCGMLLKRNGETIAEVGSLAGLPD
jgi:hypothetical protein